MQYKKKKKKKKKKSILITAGMTCLLLSILHIFYKYSTYQVFYIYSDLEVLRNELDKKEINKVNTVELIELVEFVLKKNYFQFSDKVYETVTSIKFAPLYISILMDQLVIRLQQTQKFKPFEWFRESDSFRGHVNVGGPCPPLLLFFKQKNPKKNSKLKNK